jgi:hypothetical protein
MFDFHVLKRWLLQGYHSSNQLKHKISFHNKHNQTNTILNPFMEPNRIRCLLNNKKLKQKRCHIVLNEEQNLSNV